jgi:hypothetical protein
MSKTMTVKTEQRIARPLGVLIPLIRSDIKEMETAGRKAAEAAIVPFKRAIGEKLIEAKSQLTHSEWKPWLEHNFTLSYASAKLCMSMARVDEAKGYRDSHLSQSEFIRRHITPSHGRSAKPKWQEPVKDIAGIARKQLDGQDETKAEKKLATRLIDIGYKVLSVELHPDKGGSREAMTRLNIVRDNLKVCVNEW